MNLHDLQVADLGPIALAHYRKCLANGCAPQMALMLASRQGPEMTGSDRTFNEGARQKMSKISPINQKMFEIARRAGINTNGKYHCASLGGYGNPLAWVSTIEDARESVKTQGLHARGLVNYTPPERPPQEAPRLAPDIVDAEVSKRLSRLARTKGLKPGSKGYSSAVADLREQVVEQHGRPRRPRGPGGKFSQKLLAALGGN